MSDRRRAPGWLAGTMLAAACSRTPRSAPSSEAPGTPDAAPSIAEEPRPPPTPSRKGMVWIPPGVLVAGTPPDRVPRVADEEMPGEQVPLGGFLIDEFPYPGEPGAIPRTGMTRDEAASLCAADGKRLCTELEWERACKGPSNATYATGDAYRAADCGLGGGRRLVPSGLRVACKSGFGVHDLHGGAWEWTASAWGRGGPAGLVTVRGGSDPDGERVGRCANGAAMAPSAKRGDVGFRCCAGPPNAAEVTLRLERGKPFGARELDGELASALAVAAAALPGVPLPAGSTLRLERAWTWRPIANEELVAAAGCAPDSPHRSCGLVVARLGAAAPRVLAFAASGWWMPELHDGRDPRELALYGGDRLGSLRRRIVYTAGRIAVGDPTRKGASRP